MVFLCLLVNETFSQSTISISDTSFQFDNVKLTDSITFSTDYAWMCYYYQDWLTTTKESGKAGSDIQLQITAKPNLSNLPRGGWIQIMNGFDSYYLNVRQKASENPLFYQYTTQSTSSTLSNNIVNDILIDSAGGVWLATDYGVSLYKNGDWYRYSMNNGLFNNQVNVIEEASNGELWFGTDDGVVKYANGSWKVINDSYSVNDLLLIDADTFWIASSEIREVDNGSYNLHGTYNGLSANAGLSLCTDKDGVVWVSTFYSASKNIGGFWETIAWENYTVNDGIPGYSVNDIECDESGNIWVGTNSGLGKFDGSTWSKEESFLVNDVEFDNNNILTASNEGFYKISSSTTTQYTTDDGLISNNAICIGVDKENNNWIGTDQGVSLFDGSKWTNTQTDGLKSNYIATLEIDKNDRKIMGFGTCQTGVSVYNDSSWNNSEFNTDENTNEVFIDSENNIWFATNNGVILTRSDNSTATFNEIDGLSDSRVQSVYEDQDGSIWFSTYNGVTKLANNTLTSYLKDESGLNTCVIYKATSDPDSNLWLAGMYGLYCLDGSDTTAYTTKNGLFSNQIKDVAVDSSGSVWVVNGEGISIKTDTGWVHHNLYEVFGSYPMCVEIDKYNKVWIGLAKGFLTYDNGVWYQETYTNNFNFKINAIKFDSKGDVWMGTCKNGLIHIPGSKYLSVNENSFYIEAKADSVSFFVESNTEWEIICDASWLTFNYNKGCDTSNISVYINENTSSEERTANIFVVGSGTDTVSVVLTQKIKEVIYNRITSDETGISLYPNPASDVLHIKTNMDNINSVEFFDLRGQICYTNSDCSSEVSINTAAFSKGIYVVKINTAAGNIMRKIMLK